MAGATMLPTQPLRVLVVDDEHAATKELTRLLSQDPRVGSIRHASSGAEALRVLDGEPVDVIFCDSTTPGLDRLDLARVLARLSQRPQVVFVTAHDRRPANAFNLQATDYLMKPIHAEQLSEAMCRVVKATMPAANSAATVKDETIAVELGGVTRFVQRSQVRYVEAHGDYARLHTATSSHLVRIPLTVLEERWASAGFVRIHRSTLVALPHVDEIHVDGGRCAVRLGNRVLQVSRRHTKELRDRLVRTVGLAQEKRPRHFQENQ